MHEAKEIENEDDGGKMSKKGMEKVRLKHQNVPVSCEKENEYVCD